MAAGSDSNLQLPPGFKFHPTDEELIVHYLQNKVTSRPLPASVMADINLYKFNPWDLPELSLFGEDEWYFFSPRDRKYPQGVRPNRMAPSGYWKATGTDKPISSSCKGLNHIGVKKSLVFYTGRSPKGLKTDWIMTEYRLMTKPSRLKGSMRLDDWVLCRVHKKRSMSKSMDDTGEINYRVKSPNYALKEDDTSPPNSNYNPNNITDELYQNCHILAGHFQSSIKFNKDVGFCKESGSQGKGNLRTIKRKSSEEDQLQHRFQARYKQENFPASNMMITNNINCKDQYNDYIFNPDHWTPQLIFGSLPSPHVDSNTSSWEQTAYRSSKIRSGFYSSLM